MLCRDLIAAGFDTIGDLLLFFPRDHISYGESMHSSKGVAVCSIHGRFTSNMPARSLSGCQDRWLLSAGSQLQHDAYVHMHGTVHHRAVRMGSRMMILELEAMVAAPGPAEGGSWLWPGASSAHA